MILRNKNAHKISVVKNFLFVAIFKLILSLLIYNAVKISKSEAYQAE